MRLEERIGRSEVIALMGVLISSKLYLSFPQFLVAQGGTAAWLILMISGVVAVVGFIIVALLLQRYPGRSVIEINEIVLGPVLGVGVNVILVTFFLFITVVVLREYSETTILTALPETPVSVIMTVFLLGMLGAGYMGLEAIARAAYISSPFLIVGLLLILVLVFPSFNVLHLFPLFGEGLKSTAAAGISGSANMAEVLGLAILAPVISRRGKPVSMGLKVLGISLSLMLVTVISYELSFSYPVSVENNLPVYQMARLVFFGRFFQRVESIFVLFWTVTGLLALIISFYITVFGLTKLLRLPVYRPLLWPLATVVFVLAVLPADLPATIVLDRDIIRTYGSLPTFALTAVIYTVAMVKDWAAGGRAADE